MKSIQGASIFIFLCANVDSIQKRPFPENTLHITLHIRYNQLSSENLPL